jgi:ABC-type lipoprotein release transport system permease subunit
MPTHRSSEKSTRRPTEGGSEWVVVYVVAVATTLAPAVRAARIYPAEALRYQ